MGIVVYTRLNISHVAGMQSLLASVLDKSYCPTNLVSRKDSLLLSTRWLYIQCQRAIALGYSAQFILRSSSIIFMISDWIFIRCIRFFKIGYSVKFMMIIRLFFFRALVRIAVQSPIAPLILICRKDRKEITMLNQPGSATSDNNIALIFGSFILR